MGAIVRRLKREPMLDRQDEFATFSYSAGRVDRSRAANLAMQFYRRSDNA